MQTYVVDAHALAWFITEDRRLSSATHKILELAENALVQVLIPTIILAEIAHIAQRKKVRVTVSDILSRIEKSDGFAIVPFDLEILKASLSLPKEWDIHDRIIASTARFYHATLITNDQTLRNSPEIETIWD